VRVTAPKYTILYNPELTLFKKLQQSLIKIIMLVSTGFKKTEHTFVVPLPPIKKTPIGYDKYRQLWELKFNQLPQINS
jgi:hypothetical protein